MKNLLLLFVLVLSVKANASHIASAEIRYEYMGSGNQYKIILTLLKACEPNNAGLGLTQPVMITCSGGGSLPTTHLPMVQGPDTIASYCHSIQNSCEQPTSVYPGFERRVYSSIVTLPSCSGTWKISWTGCCRPAGILNLNNPGGSSNYVESFLDNNTALNSSTWLPNPNPLWVAQGVATTFPLNAIDPENDSVAYEWFQPLTAPNTPVSYVTGYSLVAPLGAGGSATLTGNSVTVFAPSVGKFAMGLKINEYRNGQLVGYTMRDFTLVAHPSTVTLTAPAPAANTNFNYVTCPGANNSISLTFVDPTPTDSVFLTVIPPVIPGFTFNSVANPGPGSASTTITWTTPTGFNPATLPLFYLTVYAHDNSCPAQAYGYYAVAVQTAQCNTDSVWAGDANADFTVNAYDPLAIAVAYGKTGPVRPGASPTWTAQFCTSWVDTFVNGVNMKHADCNGDGIVNSNDLPPVTSNWGLVHLKEGPKLKTSGVPELYYDITGINFYPGASVSVPIKLGTALNPANNIYGVGTNVIVGGITPTTPPTITYQTTWLGPASNMLKYVKNINIGSLGWAYSRVDHQNQSGQGTIAMLNFTIPSNELPGQQITLRFTGATVINKEMSIVPFTDIDTTVLVQALSVNDINSNIQHAIIIPNPSDKEARLELTVANNSSVSLNILDQQGRVVYQQSVQALKGNNSVALPSSSLAAGLYMIRLTDQDHQRQTLKWIRK